MWLKVGISGDYFASTNITELFLIGLRIKHLQSSVEESELWSEVNRFKIKIFKMTF